MTKTKLTKIIIDILMYADFIFLMSHGTVRDLSIHAYAGMALFALFVVLHILNEWFYKTVTKEKYNAQRIFLSATAWIFMILITKHSFTSICSTLATGKWPLLIL